ncbi:hypothetical protein ACHAXS_006302 [Conticribra weissflogii]
MATRIIGSHHFFVSNAHRRSSTGRTTSFIPSSITTAASELRLPFSRGPQPTSSDSFPSSSSSASSSIITIRREKPSEQSQKHPIHRIYRIHPIHRIMPPARRVALTSLLGLAGGGASAFRASTSSSSCRSFVPAGTDFFPNDCSRYPPRRVGFVNDNDISKHDDSMRPFSSAVVASMADSVAEMDSTRQRLLQSQQQSQSSPLANDDDNEHKEKDENDTAATGEVLSFLVGNTDGGGNTAGFAVVRMSEGDVDASNPISVSTAAAAAADAANTATQEGEGEKEEEKVELASTLFGKPMPKHVESVAGKKNVHGGVMGECLDNWTFGLPVFGLLVG